MPAPTSYAGIPLSMAHLCELAVAPLELMGIAAKAGFASVGLRTNPAAAGGIFYPLGSSAEQAEMRRRIDTTGVSVLYIELISISDATRAADYRGMLETGAAIGATRLAVAGDITDRGIVAEKMAEICDLAKPLGIAVDIEFMPFRGIRTLADAVDVVQRCGRANAHILVDSLHIQRSGSSIADLARVDPRLIGTYQICDAPFAAPADLVAEARTRRLIPGHGGLPLWAMQDALPAGIPIGVEVPMPPHFPGLEPANRLARLVEETRWFLENRAGVSA